MTPTAPQELEHLPEIDPYSEEFLSDPHSVLGPLRGEHRLARSPRGIEVIGYADCAEVIANPAIPLGIEGIFEACGIEDGPTYEFAKHMTLNIEGTEHRRIRRAIAPAFRLDVFESHRETLRSLLAAHLDSLKGRSFEFQETIGRWMAGTAFCVLAGEPPEERERVWHISERAQKWYAGDPSVKQETIEAYDEAFEWVNEIIDARRRRPGEDAMSLFLQAAEAGHMSEEEVRIHFVTVLTASTHTMSGQLSMTFAALAEHPDQWAEVVRDPDLIPQTVVETARWRPGVWSLWRPAKAGVSVAGVEFPPGTTFACNVISANRDPSIWDEPDRMDIHRTPSSKPLLQWSIGRHFCPGRPYAVEQIEEALRVANAKLGVFAIDPFEYSGAPFDVSPEQMQCHLEN